MQKNKQFVILSKENYISSYISFPSASSHCPTYSSSFLICLQSVHIFLQKPDLSPSISTSPFFDASFMALFHFALRNSFTATLSNLYRRLLSRLPALPFSPLYSPPCNGSSFFFCAATLSISIPASKLCLTSSPRFYSPPPHTPSPFDAIFPSFSFFFSIFSLSLSLSAILILIQQQHRAFFCFPCILSPTSLLFTPFFPLR